VTGGEGVLTVKGVLLDMGGVVLEMAGARGFPVERLDWRGREAMGRLIRTEGGKMSADDLENLLFTPWHLDYLRRVEKGREATWEPHLERLRAAAGIVTPDLQLLAAWFRPYGEQLRPIAGAVEAVHSLRSSGLELALVSNVPLPGALYDQVLRRYDLLESFRSRRYSYDCKTRKPSPALLRAALNDLDVGPESVIMVGDRRDRDIAAGRAAGLVTVWIRGESDDGPAADAEIGSLAELPGLLRSWNDG
jgi:HAD superfamily hydrolase (TIGR01549 family)